MRLSGSRKAAQTFAELRRLGRTRPTQFFMSQRSGTGSSTAPNGLGDVLLLQEHDVAAADGWQNTEGLGTFLGVFVPCTCTIFGVVVFERLGFVVSEAGVYGAELIVLTSFGLCVLTTLSLCCGEAHSRH